MHFLFLKKTNQHRNICHHLRTIHDMSAFANIFFHLILWVRTFHECLILFCLSVCLSIAAQLTNCKWFSVMLFFLFKLKMIINSTKEIMILVVLVCLFVCLFIILLASLLKTLWTDSGEIWSRGPEWYNQQVTHFLMAIKITMMTVK